MQRDESNSVAEELTPQSLSCWPLPMPDGASDKDARGSVLVIGGCTEMPGAIILAAIAALRAGAGKLCVATGTSVAALVAQAIPEARVIGLRETNNGGLAPSEVDRLPPQIDCILIGPGMQDEHAATRLVLAVLQRYPETPVVLDATAMSVVLQAASADAALIDAAASLTHRTLHGINQPFRFTSPVLLTPHAGEMAHLTGCPKATIQTDPASVALQHAAKWNAVIALKGADTFIATANGTLRRHRGGNVGLAISGSGDTLAGIIAGLAARGASLEQAAAWGVTVHALAGAALEKKLGPLGYLSRELATEVPTILRDIAELKQPST